MATIIDEEEGKRTPVQYYKCEFEVASRMMNAATKRIIELEEALAESERKNADIDHVKKFYEEKLAKLHRQQLYSVERMGKRIDVLEAELMNRTVKLENSREKLRKAVEKVVFLQNEISSSLLSADEEKRSSETAKAQEEDRAATVKPKRQFFVREEDKKEVSSFPSSAGSEGQFEGSGPSSIKRCKVESFSNDWDDSVIVPDSFMTFVDYPATSNKPKSGLAGFFAFGSRNKEREPIRSATGKPSGCASRPNVIEHFEDNSVPATILIGSQQF